MLESGFLIPIIMLVVGGGVLLLLSRLKEKPKTDSAEAPKEIELTERFCIGSYLGGLHNADKAPLVFCGVGEDEFIFRRGSQGAEIGRIHRDAVNDVIVGEKNQIAEQLTAQEQLCLGKISPSKKNNSSCLLINWNNSDNTTHNSIFEFANPSAAQSTADIIKKWVKQRQVSVQNISNAS
jgi:hypothetical protein